MDLLIPGSAERAVEDSGGVGNSISVSGVLGGSSAGLGALAPRAAAGAAGGGLLWSAGGVGSWQESAEVPPSPAAGFAGQGMLSGQQQELLLQLQRGSFQLQSSAAVVQPV